MCIFIPKMKFLWLPIWTGEYTKEKFQNGHLTTTSWNDYRSHQQILGTYVYTRIHTKYDLSMTIYLGMRTTQIKVPKNPQFKNYNSKLVNI